MIETDLPGADLPSLDGRSFVMRSSTASMVDPVAPTTFRYHEKNGLVWGEYDGDTVSIGRFVGTRVGNAIEVSFAHLAAETGLVASGTSLSVVELGADGLIRLVEAFTVDGVDHVSVCVEN